MPIPGVLSCPRPSLTWLVRCISNSWPPLGFGLLLSLLFSLSLRCFFSYLPQPQPLRATSPTLQGTTLHHTHSQFNPAPPSLRGPQKAPSHTPKWKPGQQFTLLLLPHSTRYSSSKFGRHIRLLTVPTAS